MVPRLLTHQCSILLWGFLFRTFLPVQANEVGWILRITTYVCGWGGALKSEKTFLWPYRTSLLPPLSPQYVLTAARKILLNSQSDTSLLCSHSLREKTKVLTVVQNALNPVSLFTHLSSLPTTFFLAYSTSDSLVSLVIFKKVLFKLVSSI